MPVIVPDIVVNIVLHNVHIIPDIITPKLHDVVTKQPDIINDIVYPILVTPFSAGAISGLLARDL